MAVAAILSKINITPASLDTEATVTMKGLRITNINLSITGLVPDTTADDFTAITNDAEKNCLISKILNIPISSDAHFKSQSLKLI